MALQHRFRDGTGRGRHATGAQRYGAGCLARASAPAEAPWTA